MKASTFTLKIPKSNLVDSYNSESLEDLMTMHTAKINKLISYLDNMYTQSS